MKKASKHLSTPDTANPFVELWLSARLATRSYIHVDTPRRQFTAGATVHARVSHSVNVHQRLHTDGDEICLVLLDEQLTDQAAGRLERALRDLEYLEQVSGADGLAHILTFFLVADDEESIHGPGILSEHGITEELIKKSPDAAQQRLQHLKIIEDIEPPKSATQHSLTLHKQLTRPIFVLNDVLDLWELAGSEIVQPASMSEKVTHENNRGAYAEWTFGSIPAMPLNLNNSESVSSEEAIRQQNEKIRDQFRPLLSNFLSAASGRRRWQLSHRTTEHVATNQNTRPGDERECAGASGTNSGAPSYTRALADESVTESAERNRIRAVGGAWEVRFDGTRLQMKDRVGVQYLQYFLTHPNVWSDPVTVEMLCQEEQRRRRHKQPPLDSVEVERLLDKADRTTSKDKSEARRRVLQQINREISNLEDREFADYLTETISGASNQMDLKLRFVPKSDETWDD